MGRRQKRCSLTCRPLTDCLLTSRFYKSHRIGHRIEFVTTNKLPIAASPCQPIGLRRGTSLLEVFMVLLILTGSLSLIGVTRTFESRTGVQQDAREVLSCLRLGRETAIMSQCNVSIRIAKLNDPVDGDTRLGLDLKIESNPYTADADAQGVGHFGKQSTTGKQAMYAPIFFTSSTSVDFNLDEVIFKPTGQASRDTKWRISNGGEAITIGVEALTGNILGEGTL